MWAFHLVLPHQITDITQLSHFIARFSHSSIWRNSINLTSKKLHLIFITRTSAPCSTSMTGFKDELDSELRLRIIRLLYT